MIVYGKIVNAMYIFNILFQSLFNLATPILIMLGLSWLLVEKCSAPRWIYAILGVLGAIVGFISMIKFIVKACESLERLEKELYNFANIKTLRPKRKAMKEAKAVIEEKYNVKLEDLK